MNNYDTVRENFEIKLAQMFPKNEIEKIMTCFDTCLKDYDITAKETGLVIYDGNATDVLIDYYINAMETKTYREHTLEERKRTLSRFFRIIGKMPTEIEHQDIYIYKYVLVKDNVQANTINSYLSQISAFFTWAVKRNIAKFNPIESDDFCKVVPTDKQPLSDDEIETVRRAIGCNIFLSALFEFMLSTGMRREEISKAKKTDIMYDKADDFGCVPIRIPDGKGGKYRYTFISKRAIDLLNQYFNSRNDSYDSLFVNKRGTPISCHTINDAFEYIRRMTGVKELTPHTMRRTFATNSVQGGVTINAVARVMGHSSVDTTMGYAKDTMETLQNQFRKVM